LPGRWPLYSVLRFWEKPPLAVAADLQQRGGLWNRFVIVALGESKRLAAARRELQWPA
jgi:hypothetical protein